MNPLNFLTKKLQSIILAGELVVAVVAGTSANILVLERDKDGKVRRAEGTDVPTDDTAGYSKGCIFIDTNVAAGTTGLYENVGTTALCNFDVINS